VGGGRAGPCDTQRMSQPNVEVIRRGLEALSSGDIERIFEFVDPEFEGQVPPELSTEPDTYRGHAGIRRYFQSFWEVMDDIRFQAERLWEAGDSVVADTRMTGRGKQTAIAVEQRFGQIWTLRDGRAIAVENFATVGDALEAAGLAGEV
jgi:ketosteroid isomerase-like protein